MKLEWKWTLETALAFVRELEFHLAPKYHVALCGSVLHAGVSRKDLDIMIFPHRTSENTYTEVRELLEGFEMLCLVDLETVQSKWKSVEKSTDTKHVEVWDHRGLRVDVFQPYLK